MTDQSLDVLLARAAGSPEATLLAADRAGCLESFPRFARRFLGVMRPDPNDAWVDGVAIESIMAFLVAVADRRIPRGALTCPPGTGKSVLLCLLVAWLMLRTPTTSVLRVSSTHELALRDSQRTRDLIDSDLFRRYFGDRLRISSDQATKTRWETSAGGGLFAIGIGGAISGWRGSIVLVDDPVTVEQGDQEVRREFANQYFARTLQSRVNDLARSAILLVTTRIHPSDMVAEAVKLGYVHFNVPAIMDRENGAPCDCPELGIVDRRADGESFWEERFPIKQLVDVVRPGLPAYDWSVQYQGHPTPREGGLMQAKDFENAVVAASPAGLYATRFVAVDQASSEGKGDYSVITAGAGIPGRMVVENVWMGQWGPAELLSNVLTVAGLLGTGVPWSIPEDGGKLASSFLARPLRERAHQVYTSPEVTLAKGSGSTRGVSKLKRAAGLIAMVQNGNLLLVRGTWNAALVEQFCRIPHGHDDILDSVNRAWLEIDQRKGFSGGSAGGCDVGGLLLMARINAEIHNLPVPAEANESAHPPREENVQRLAADEPQGKKSEPDRPALEERKF